MGPLREGLVSSQSYQMLENHVSEFVSQTQAAEQHGDSSRVVEDHDFVIFDSRKSMNL